MANKGKIAGFVKNKNKTIFNTQLDSWIYPKVLILIFQKMGKFRSTSTLKSGWFSWQIFLFLKIVKFIIHSVFNTFVIIYLNQREIGF